MKEILRHVPTEHTMPLPIKPGNVRRVIEKFERQMSLTVLSYNINRTSNIIGVKIMIEALT